jgi:hypothetical protein
VNVRSVVVESMNDGFWPAGAGHTQAAKWRYRPSADLRGRPLSGTDVSGLVRRLDVEPDLRVAIKKSRCVSCANLLRMPSGDKRAAMARATANDLIAHGCAGMQLHPCCPEAPASLLTGQTSGPRRHRECSSIQVVKSNRIVPHYHVRNLAGSAARDVTLVYHGAERNRQGVTGVVGHQPLLF